MFGGQLECPPVSLEEQSNRRLREWNTLFVCRKCQEGVAVKFKGPKESSPGNYSGDPQDHEFELIAIHPKPQPIDVPEHVPDGIANDYKEAADNLRRQHFTSAGIMFRKVLEWATTEIAA